MVKNSVVPTWFSRLRYAPVQYCTRLEPQPVASRHHGMNHWTFFFKKNESQDNVLSHTVSQSPSRELFPSCCLRSPCDARRTHIILPLRYLLSVKPRGIICHKMYCVSVITSDNNDNSDFGNTWWYARLLIHYILRQGRCN
jgi:hypothetical protein